MNTKLMQAMNFTEADITANQQGQLSEQQRASLPSANWQPMQRNLGYGVAIFISLIILRLMWEQEKARWFEEFEVTSWDMSLNFFTIIAILIGLFFLYRAYDLRPHLPRQIEVKRVTGTAMLSAGVLTNGTPVYRVRIDDPEIVIKDPVFVVPKAAYHTFKQGQKYHVYYVPGVGILTAETA